MPISYSKVKSFPGSIWRKMLSDLPDGLTCRPVRVEVRGAKAMDISAVGRSAGSMPGSADPWTWFFDVDLVTFRCALTG